MCTLIGLTDITRTLLKRAELWNGRQEIAEEIAFKMVPDDILKKVRSLEAHGSSHFR